MLRLIWCTLFCLSLLAACSKDKGSNSTTERLGVTEDTILLGSSLALSGHAGYLGTHYLHGALSYINEVNLKGGIHNRKINIAAFDDQYNPTKTIANTQKLIHEEQVFALMNYVGTPTSAAVKPIIEKTGIPAFGFLTGAELLREPTIRNIFHLRDSYYAEVEGAVSYFVDKIGLKKIGVLYQEDAFGLSVLTGIQKALLARKMEPVVTDTFVRGSTDLQTSLKRIHAIDVEVVMMVGTSRPLAKFIKETHRKGKFPYFSTVSFVGSEVFAQELIEVQKIETKQHKKIIVTQVVPSPYSEKYKVIWEYLTLSLKYYLEDKPNYVAFEGFLNAKMVVLALENCGKDLTRTRFIEELEKLQDYDLGIEKTISYNQQDHRGISGIYYSRLGVGNRFEVFDINQD